MICCAMSAKGCHGELVNKEVDLTRTACINQPCMVSNLTLSRFKAGSASCQGILFNQFMTNLYLSLNI